MAVLFIVGGMGALLFSAFYSTLLPATSVAVAPTQPAGPINSNPAIVTATSVALAPESPTLTLPPSAEGQPSPTGDVVGGGLTQPVVATATPEAIQPAATQPPTQGTVDQPTITPSAPTDTPVPGASPTFDDNPTLLFATQDSATETATPEPLKDPGGSVELSVAQVQRMQVSGGYVVMVDVGNLTEQPLKDVVLVFTNASGARIGGPRPLALHIPANDARPGATGVIAANDPIFTNWSAVQVHALGTPVTAQSGQAGYPMVLDTELAQVTASSSGYSYQVTIVNNTGGRVAIPYQNISFFSNDGVLLFVANLGNHAAINDGESYQLSGTIPAAQPAAEGRSLAEYSDVLAIISAEASP